ncbi:MAG: NADAR family protein [Nanoarchaeota archaeon]
METTINKEQFKFFWDGPFSQWHPSKFIIDGVEFNKCEQYMMYKKALMFGDFESAKKVMATSNPKEQKQIGREVKGFKDDVWIKYCRKIVYDANVAKFTQNPDLLKTLMDTGEAILVEASPYDKRWGIGLGAENPFAQDRSTWQGLNWLGEAITQVRKDIKSGKI